ncbi:MAG: DAK2 domain-containing protein, partial [Oscillospiraceae bacterium]|nr:DAK2 domain-containing protein [Oscillospiraceae bacterium]
MLSGKMLKEGIQNAARHLGTHTAEVDALNVFPVPDGDTGTNMAMTLDAAARALAQLDDGSRFDDAAERAAAAMLRGARGNSGVILSLIFRGFAKSVKGKPLLDGPGLARALEQGSQAAYGAVMKPAEGTILTVAREAAQRALETSLGVTGDVLTVWRAALEAARESLASTQYLLPALRQAGVVDAGGQGLVYIMEGLLHGFSGGKSGWEGEAFVAGSNPARKNPAARCDGEIRFAYCTEALIERGPGAPACDADMLRASLLELGDSVVVADGGDVLRVHVHSNRPGDVLRFAQSCGELLQVKVENMRQQHQDTMRQGEELPAPVRKRYGVVAVAAGEGMSKLFGEIGADAVIAGGQSMNPSTEDILRAVNSVPAEHVFVLPNNANILMAAEQAAPLTSRGVSVVRTGSVPEGVAAALAFDESEGVERNHVQMQRAAGRVQTGLVTYAVRDSRAEGLDIRKGAVIGLENGKLTVTGDEPVTAAWRVARHLVRKHG